MYCIEKSIRYNKESNKRVTIWQISVKNIKEIK